MGVVKKHHPLTVTQTQKIVPNSLAEKQLINVSWSALENVPKRLRNRSPWLFSPHRQPSFYDEGPFLKQDSLQNKMPPPESKQDSENLGLNKQIKRQPEIKIGE